MLGREATIVGTGLEPGRLLIVKLADDGIGLGLVGLTMVVGAVPVLALVGILVTLVNEDLLSKLGTLEALEVEPIERGVNEIGLVEEKSMSEVIYVRVELRTLEAAGF